MIYIYGMPLYKVLLPMFFSATLWLLRVLPKKALYLSSVLILLLSLWGIARYCVVFREASAQHIFIYSTTYADLGEEYFREMVMNMLLYFPLGISLSFFCRPMVNLGGVSAFIWGRVLAISRGNWTCAGNGCDYEYSRSCLRFAALAYSE